LIHYVPKQFLPDIWPSIEGFVVRTCKFHPFMEAGDVYALLEHDLLSLFIATDDQGVMGFGALEVVNYPRCRVANILGCGGRRGFLPVAVNELLPFMIEHGTTQGANFVALSGRPGWLRELRHLNGRSQRFITWWADIEQGRRIKPTTDHDSRAVETSTAVPH
jgi:hypothetical protein